jgi:hypothetical protein
VRLLAGLAALALGVQAVPGIVATVGRSAVELTLGLLRALA